MTSMFTIPHNILLLFAVGIVGLTIGFVIYGFIKGWENVMPENDKMKQEKAAEDQTD
jgi:hypothetical protein